MSHFRSPLALLAAVLFGLASASAPAAAQSASAILTPAAASTLGPGDFLWADTGGGPAVSILVSIPLQRVYVFRGTQVVAVSPVSTGAPGYDTPTGTFTILQKNMHHRSNLYNDAPMPYMMRLTWGGVAIHAGRNPGYPDSHGCVRVPLAFARKLFAITSLGAPVMVTDDPADPLMGQTPVYTYPAPYLPAASAAIEIALLSEGPPAFGSARGPARSFGRQNR